MIILEKEIFNNESVKRATREYVFYNYTKSLCELVTSLTKRHSLDIEEIVTIMYTYSKNYKVNTFSVEEVFSSREERILSFIVNEIVKEYLSDSLKTKHGRYDKESVVQSLHSIKNLISIFSYKNELVEEKEFVEIIEIVAETTGDFLNLKIAENDSDLLRIISNFF